MSCRVVVGAQWGDEGKGKIVDLLSQEAVGEEIVKLLLGQMAAGGGAPAGR